MQNEQIKPDFEFIALMASLMSITALAIDAVLPALPEIGLAINTPDTTDHQLLITMIFLGLGVGQLFFGPLSDAYGRKPIVYFGFTLFFIASFICVMATSLEFMLAGRVLQGIALSAPRTMSISIIRDTYSGDYMARVMSFVTAFFILVPVVAPLLGKWILDVYGWEAIFYSQLLFGVLVALWFWKRQAETLKPEFKIPFRFKVFKSGFIEFMKYRESVAFTLISGLVTGAFLVYLSAAQNVFEKQYQMPDEFPYLFAALAISIGLATFMNGTLVLRMGMRKLALAALVAFCLSAVLYCVIFYGSANPSIYVLIPFLALQFYGLGFLWGNFRAIAMEPLGHIAGIGAAINGFFSTVISVPIAIFIGGFIEDTVWPMFAGLAVCGLLALGIMLLVRNNTKIRV